MFEDRETEIKELVEARKVKIAEDQAWDILHKAEEIIIGRGSKYLVLYPTQDSKKEILSSCLGRSGTLRAPALKIGKRYLIGFNQDMYNTYLK